MINYYNIGKSSMETGYIISDIIRKERMIVSRKIWNNSNIWQMNQYFTCWNRLTRDPGEVREVTLDMILTDKLTINCYGMEIKILPHHWNSVNYLQNWILSVIFLGIISLTEDLTPEKPQMSPNWTKLRPISRYYAKQRYYLINRDDE